MSIPDDPVEFLRETVPSLAAKGVEELAKDAEKAADLDKADRLFRVRYAGEDGTDVYLRFAGRKLTVLEAPDRGTPLAAISLPIETARDLHERALDAGTLARPQIPARLARALSHPRLARIEGERIRLQLVVADGPSGDDIVVDVALGGADLDAKPECVAKIVYDDLEEARKAGRSPKDLLTGGKVKLTGDATRVMQLGMKMMS
ncbi:MAG: hypothetical protein IT379_05290 [Deltaproteobacteria bacterium]|nr:hypothetical protein [Deltaproteobacteria bacterium]